MENRNEKAAGAGTPCGGKRVNYLPLDYSMGDGKEQLKITKLLWLFELCLKVNGLSSRRKELTSDLPAVLFDFSGHVSGIYINIYSHGYSDDEYPDIKFNFYVNEELGEDYISAYHYLSNLKHDLELRHG